MSDQSKPELPRVEFLCVAKQRDGVTFSPASDAAPAQFDIDTRLRWKTKPREASQFRVGRVYAIPAEKTDTGWTAVLGRATFARVHDDAVLVARLEAQEALRLVDDERVKKEKAAHDYDELARRLLPYRMLYATERFNPARRRVLELMLLETLHKTPTTDELAKGGTPDE